MCQTFLAMYHKHGYITTDIMFDQVRLHYFSMNQTREEVRKTAKELDTIRLAESDIEFIENEKIDQLTFDIVWALWK